jgi:hypothetical protein
MRVRAMGIRDDGPYAYYVRYRKTASTVQYQSELQRVE